MKTALAIAEEGWREPVAEPRASAPAIEMRVEPASAIGERLLSAWNDLAAHASEPDSFAESWFVTAGLRHLGGAGDVRLLEIWEAGAVPRLIGLFPLAVMPRYGRVPVRHVQNWKHENDFLGLPLIRAGEEERAWSHVMEALDGASWAPGFLHFNGLVEDGPVHAGLVAAAAAVGRRCDVVHREVRALLASPLSPEAYYADTVRKKKRKELGRLQRRLGDLGAVTASTLADPGELTAWCDAFLHLEHSGWKGRAGSSLASAPETEAFFRDAMAGALAAGRLEFRRMDLDGKPIAMLINFIAPPGSFSFKTAFDEDYAKYSPGVLIQLDNLSIMQRANIDWMDSCAAQDHPMIDSLWGERRTIVRVSIPLSGVRRGLEFKLTRAMEDGSARMRKAAQARAGTKEQTDG